MTTDELQHAAFSAAVMLLWDARKDTADMAAILMRPEADVARALWRGRELRRADHARSA